VASFALARCSVQGDVVVPHWLTERDYPWLADLIEAYTAFVGEPRRRLDDTLAAQATGAAQAPPGWRMAAQVLDRVFRTEIAAVVKPARARAAVFQASVSRDSRARILERVARDLGTTALALERSLFADLAGERLLRAPDEPVHVSSLALQCNLAIAQAALKRSARVEITLEGNARAVVRHAKLRGLICTVSRSPGGDTTLEISGPLALFKQTALYGRHLAELVPMLPWSRRFELRADCTLHGREARLTLTPADPLPPGLAPKRYDSRLEERFAREFARATKEWTLIREPEPVAAEGTLIFPDFALVHRREPHRRWLLEIVGFWTSGYVERKLRRLRAAGIDNLVLCIDESLDCHGVALPEDCPVLRFRKRVDPQAVLKLIEERDGPGRVGPGVPLRGEHQPTCPQRVAPLRRPSCGDS